MRDLDALLVRIGAVLDLPALPPLAPTAEKPRPRPPRPFPPSESDAMRRRVETARAGLDAKADRLAADLAPQPRSWFGRWRRRG